MVLQNSLFMVILFHHLSDCDLYTPPRGVKGDRTRWRLTSQDKTRSSFLNEGLHLLHGLALLSTAVLKPLILSRWNTNNRAICVRRLFLWERTAHFIFLSLYWLWTITLTNLCVRIPVFASILINNDLGLKREYTAEKENSYVIVYWIRTSILKGKLSNIGLVCHSYLLENLCPLLNYFCNFNKKK